jgi:hypothetical protein
VCPNCGGELDTDKDKPWETIPHKLEVCVQYLRDLINDLTWKVDMIQGNDGD